MSNYDYDFHVMDPNQAQIQFKYRTYSHCGASLKKLADEKVRDGWRLVQVLSAPVDDTKSIAPLLVIFEKRTNQVQDDPVTGVKKPGNDEETAKTSPVDFFKSINLSHILLTVLIILSGVCAAIYFLSK